MPACAEDTTTEPGTLLIREEKPTILAFEFGFPSGLGLFGLHNITSRYAIGATAGYALLWSNIGAVGRYYLNDDRKTNFLELRANGHPRFAEGAPTFGPIFSGHLLYGWEERTATGYYSHFALGMGAGNTNDPYLWIGFFNIEAALGYAF